MSAATLAGIGLFALLAAMPAIAGDLSAHATGFARNSMRADLPYDREVGWGADLGGPLRGAWSFARGRRTGRSYTNQRVDIGAGRSQIEASVAWRDLQERDLWTFGATLAWRRGGDRLSWSAGATRQWSRIGFENPATLLHLSVRHAGRLPIVGRAALDRKVSVVLDAGGDRRALNVTAELLVQVWRVSVGAVGAYDELRRDQAPTLRVFGATALSRVRLL